MVVFVTTGDCNKLCRNTKKNRKISYCTPACPYSSYVVVQPVTRSPADMLAGTSYIRC